MNLTVGQYIEAICSPEGRFRTIGRLRPLWETGSKGGGSDTGAGQEAAMPRMSIAGGCRGGTGGGAGGVVDFEVVADGRPTTLRCPLVWDQSVTGRLKALIRPERGLGGKYLDEWRLRRRELVLFDTEGVPTQVDILTRETPDGDTLDEFVARVAERGDGAAARAALVSFEQMVAWLRDKGRGGIAMRRLRVTPEGAVSITGLSAVDQTERIREALRVAMAGPVSPAEDLPDENMRPVRDGGGWMYVDRLGRPVIDAVWRSAAPFRGDRAVIETDTGYGLIDRTGRPVIAPVFEEVVWDPDWMIAILMTEGRWSMADGDGRILTPEPCDWLGECAEGLVLAQRGDLCGFLDTAGREAIPFIYDDAGSFHRGVAPVSVGDESFYIDPQGGRI